MQSHQQGSNRTAYHATNAERTTTQETVQIHLSKETQAKIKEHQLFVLEALSQSNKKLDPKFETLQQLIKEQQKPVEYKSYSLSLPACN